MPREHPTATRAELVRLCARAYAILTTVEDEAWDHDTDAAGELVESVAALERAIARLRGGE